jgi:hypothetical protein
MVCGAVPRPRDILLVPLSALVAVVGIGWGGWSSYRAVRNRTPTAITCADFLAHRDAADWVRLEGCNADVDHVALEKFGPKQKSQSLDIVNPSAIYIPLLVPGAASDDRVALLLRVDSGPLLRLGERFPTDAEVAVAYDALEVPIEGLVERRLDRSERDREKIRSLGLYLADDFLIVEYGARPRPIWLAFGTLAIGIGAFTWLTRKWRRRKRPPELAKARVVST